MPPSLTPVPPTQMPQTRCCSLMPSGCHFCTTCSFHPARKARELVACKLAYCVPLVCIRTSHQHLGIKPPQFLCLGLPGAGLSPVHPRPLHTRPLLGLEARLHVQRLRVKRPRIRRLSSRWRIPRARNAWRTRRRRDLTVQTTIFPSRSRSSIRLLAVPVHVLRAASARHRWWLCSMPCR